MIKKIQIIIITVFWILGTTIIASLGFLNIKNLEDIKEINNKQTVNISEENKSKSEKKESNLIVENNITEKIQNTKIITISAISVYTLISIIICAIELKNNNIIISNLVKEFGKEYDEKKSKNNYLIEKEKTKNSNELVDAFKLISTEINDELSKVKEEKRQIENILLHMSDGVIAFNLEGKIIYINPAANNLLGLTTDDDSFDKIFKKLDVGADLEKII